MILDKGRRYEMGMISLVIVLIMLGDIFKMLYRLFARTTKKISELGEIQFKESIKYPAKLIHLVGVVIFFVLVSCSSELIYNNFLILFMVFLVIAITWFYIYLTKRLIITEKGIGYLGIRNLVITFIEWGDMEFVYMEKTKVVLYLKTKEKRRYYISLTNEEANEVQSYFPKDINKYLYSI